MALIQLKVTEEQKEKLLHHAKEIAHSSTLGGWIKMLIISEVEKGKRV